MGLDLGNVASILAAAAVGGLGATLLQQHRAVSTARRVRRDQEREAALQNLVAACADLEAHVDFMLSPDRRSPDGVFQTNTLLAAEGIVANLQTCWRTDAAPFLPKAGATAASILEALYEAQRVLDGTNPPVPDFYERLHDLRGAAASLREVAQAEVVKPSKRQRRP